MRFKNISPRKNQSHQVFFGHYKKWECYLYYSVEFQHWFFTVYPNDRMRNGYSCLIDSGITFKSQEACIANLQQYIDKESHS